MSNSYMGPPSGDQSQYGNMKWVKEFNPEQQWASIRKEREKELEAARLAHIAKLEQVIRAEEEKNRPQGDSFDLGGAL
jgi:hypothetical protein